MIFDMYGKQGIGYNTIAHELNQMNIPSLTGTWGQTSITNILNNEVYKEDKVEQTDTTETVLSIVREQLTELQLQQDKICEYLEKGIYTIEMFTKRNDTLTREIHKVQAAENELLKKQGLKKIFMMWRKK